MALLVEGAGLAVAGEDGVVPRQRRKALEGGEHGLPRAAGEVRAAAGTGEEGVSGEEEIPTKQAHRAGGVAGGLQHPEGDGIHGNFVSVFIEVRPAEPPGHGGGQAGVGGVDVDGQIGIGRAEGCQAAHVVVVAVGEEDVGGGEPLAGEPLSHGVAVVTGIDDGAAAGLFVRKDVAIGLQLPKGEGEKLHVDLLI